MDAIARADRHAPRPDRLVHEPIKALTIRDMGPLWR
jgi:hypothetical protein